MPTAPVAIERTEPEDRISALLRQRYRTEPAPAPLPCHDTIEAILGHRSVRAYLPDALPAGTLELLVAAAQSASTSSNMQAWSVVAVQDPARKARLAKLAGPNRQIEEAPLFLVWIADLARSRAIALDQGQPGDALDYLESFLLGAIDAALAAQNAAVAVDGLGLGSCYIGGIRNHPEAVAAELGLPPEAVAIFGLTVGIPDPARPAGIKPRLPQTSVLHHEHYSAVTRAEDLSAYNAALRGFQAEQDLPPTDWTGTIAQRIGTVAALKGRDALTTVLRRLGFKLL